LAGSLRRKWLEKPAEYRVCVSCFDRLEPQNALAGKRESVSGGVMQHEAAQLFDQKAFSSTGGWNGRETAWNGRETQSLPTFS